MGGIFVIFLSSFNELQSREERCGGEEPAKKIARARPDLAHSGSQTGTLIVAEGGRREREGLVTERFTVAIDS